jgi:uncharacterized protein involved in exopolysaccharide biosynthesis
METLLPPSVRTLPSADQGPALVPQTDYNAAGEVPAGLQNRITWLVIRRWKRTIILTAMAGILAGVLASMLIRPRWEVRASLEVQDVNTEFMNTKAVEPLNQDTAASAYFSDIQTQIQILQSDTLLNRVVREVSNARAKGGKVPEETLREINRGPWDRLALSN